VFTINAVGFDVSKEDKTLISKMISYIFPDDKFKHTTTDIHCYPLEGKDEDIYFLYGKKAIRKFTLETKDKNYKHVLKLPETEELKKSNTTNKRKEVIEELEKFRNNLLENKIEKKEIEIKKIMITTKNNEKIIVADDQADLNLNEIKQLIDFFKHQVFQEVSIEFIKSTGSNIV